MTDAVPLIVLVPVLLALMPALLPRATSARRVALTGVGMALLTLVLAVCAFWPAGDALLAGSGTVWRDDALARALSVLPAASWLLVALRSAEQFDTARLGAERWRRWPIVAQFGTASAMALCRVELLALLPLAFAVLLVAMARLDRRDWLDAAASLGPLLAMEAGIVVLSVGLGGPARWSAFAVQDNIMPRVLLVTGTALLMMPALLLALSSAIRPALQEQDSSLHGLGRLLVAVPSLGLVLRAAAPPGSPVGSIAVLTGLVWIGVSVSLLPSRRLLAQRVSLAASVQLGAALVGIGAGGPGGIAGALIVMAVLSALLPVALSSPADAAGSRLRGVAIASLVGLPPFASFAAGLVLLLRLFALSPWLAVFVLAGFGVSAVAVLDALRRDETRDGGRKSMVWLVCGTTVLAMSGWFGLAMPTALADWLLALAETGP